MNDPTHDLSMQVRKLERKTRLLSHSLVAMMVLAVCAAFAPNRDTVAARSIKLLDARGKVRAELGADEDGSTGLFLLDAAGRVRASLTHDDAQTALYLLDETGNTRVGAAQYEHGGGGIALRGVDDKRAVELFLKGDGNLTFYDKTGEISARLPD